MASSTFHGAVQTPDPPKRCGGAPQGAGVDGRPLGERAGSVPRAPPGGVGGACSVPASESPTPFATTEMMTAGTDEFSVDVDGNRVSVRGAVDAHTAPTLQARFDRIAEDQRAMVALFMVPFMDSTGLRVLVATAARLRKGGGDLVLGPLSTTVQRLL